MQDSPLAVAYDHTIFTVQRYGGISRLFAHLIPEVAALPHTSVDLYMGLYVNRHGLESLAPTCRHFLGLPRPDLRRTHRAALGLGNLLLPALWDRWRPSVYHATGYTSLAPRFRGARVVTLFDLIPQRLDDERLEPSADAAAKRAALEAADGIICISECTCRDAEELLGIDRRRMTVIPLAGFPRPTLESGPAPVPGPYVLFVGRRDGYKNFAMVLRGLAARPRLAKELSLVCFGGGSFSPAERALASELGLARALRHVTGDDQALANALRGADAFVLPSLYEGFGLPLLEAMQHECPVVASRAGALPEVGGEAALYFDPTQAEELADALERVLEDRMLREGLVAAGRERSEVFSWARAARETRSYYARLA